MFVSDEDRAWLSHAYPLLQIENGQVFGAVAFRGWYDSVSELFKVLSDEEKPSAGIALLCNFSVRIKDRTNTLNSLLPELRIDGIKPLSDRHINEGDSTACLMTPLEEDKFLLPQFKFRLFFERLVIPFLYGQAFYEIHKKWPWKDLSHRALGVLESYGQISSPTATHLHTCIQHLQHDNNLWPNIRRLLSQSRSIPEYERCLCGERRIFRVCHGVALAGLDALRH